jgi:hypothetical protein
MDEHAQRILTCVSMRIPDKMKEQFLQLNSESFRQDEFEEEPAQRRYST